MLDLIVSVPDHCLSFYFVKKKFYIDLFYFTASCPMREPEPYQIMKENAGFVQFHILY